MRMQFFAHGIGVVTLTTERAESSYGQPVLVLPTGEVLGYGDADVFVDDDACIDSVRLYAIDGETYDFAECNHLRTLEPSRARMSPLTGDVLADMFSDDSRPAHGWRIQMSVCRCGKHHITPKHMAAQMGEALANCPECAREASRG